MKLSRLSFVLILIGSALLLSAVSESASLPLEPVPKENKSLPEEKQIRGDQKQENTKSPPISEFKSQSAPVTNQKSRNDRAPAKQPVPSITDWIMVGVTTAYAIFALLQWCAIRRQAKFARHTLRAIRRQADIAEKSLTLLERAWLDIEIDPIPLEIGPTLVTVNIRNTGRTPARIKRVYVAIPNWTEAAPAIEIAPKPVERLPTVWTIPANQVLPWEMKPVPKIQPGVESGGRLIVHGYVLYDDILGNRHITRFYRHYQKARGGSVRFIVTPDDPPEYNEAD